MIDNVPSTEELTYQGGATGGTESDEVTALLAQLEDGSGPTPEQVDAMKNVPVRKEPYLAEVVGHSLSSSEKGVRLVVQSTVIGEGQSQGRRLPLLSVPLGATAVGPSGMRSDFMLWQLADGCYGVETRKAIQKANPGYKATLTAILKDLAGKKFLATLDARKSKKDGKTYVNIVRISPPTGVGVGTVLEDTSEAT